MEKEPCQAFRAGKCDGKGCIYSHEQPPLPEHCEILPCADFKQGVCMDNDCHGNHTPGVGEVCFWADTTLDQKRNADDKMPYLLAKVGPRECIVRMDTCCELAGVINTDIAKAMQQEDPKNVKIKWDNKPGARTFNNKTVMLAGWMATQITFEDSKTGDTVKLQVHFAIIDGVSVHPLVGWPVLRKRCYRNRDDTYTICNKIRVNMVTRGFAWSRGNEHLQEIEDQQPAVRAVAMQMGNLYDREAVFDYSPTISARR